jgi:hypothetical protein
MTVFRILCLLAKQYDRYQMHHLAVSHLLAITYINNIKVMPIYASSACSKNNKKDVLPRLGN